MNSPKDYLTDRKSEFRKQFCEEVKNIHDEGTHLEVKQINSPDKLEAFLTDTIQQSMEVGREEEVCICAAIKMPDGYIVRGHRHNDCLRTMKGIQRYIDDDFDSLEQGFMTTRNRFVDRMEALRLQRAAGIKSADGTYRWSEGLYSEDLY